MLKPIKIIECPRDAMQGLHDFIPTTTKAAYINKLLQVGYDTLDFGSFVSPKAIPQMQDTKAVLGLLDLTTTKTKLLAIVANTRGANEACQYSEITYLGFPFSISETFQQRNTNSSIEASLATVQEMLNLCNSHNKELVVYLSMGFGNPYGDEWNLSLVEMWTEKLVKMGVKIISVADTTGVATPQVIREVVTHLVINFPNTEIGVHLHSTPLEALNKIHAAYNAGCRRFDSAIMGFGGCPMAADDLTGNIATEALISALEVKGETLPLNQAVFQEARVLAAEIFT